MLQSGRTTDHRGDGTAIRCSSQRERESCAHPNPMKTTPQKYRQASVLDLVPHPKNPRQGDIGAIHQSIEANGWYGAIIVQASTGHVIAGNHRLQAAIHAGATKVPIIELDVDDKTALRILLTDNRTSDIATNDDDALAALLRELNATPLGLDGTGYDTDDLDALLSDAAMPDIPEPKTAEQRPHTCPSCGFEWRTDADGSIMPV